MLEVVLLSVLIAGLVGAAAGYAGGLGVQWELRIKLADVRSRVIGLEQVGEAMDRRIKQREGQAGQAVRQAQKSTADRELEALARAAALRGAKPRLVEGDIGDPELARRAFAEAERSK